VKYVAEWPVNVVACATQHQYCLVHTGQCSKLQGSSGQAFPLTIRQKGVLTRLSEPNIANLFLIVGSTNLLAMDYCFSGVCAPLPDNHWRSEFQNIFSTLLAGIQQFSLAYAAGPLNPIFEPFWAPAIANHSWMCESQIALRADYSSFSVLGIAIIIGIGGLVMIASLAVEWMPVCFKSWFRGHTTGDWHFLSLFHLHRLAWEHCQEDITWTRLEKDVPVLETSERFDRFNRLVDGKPARQRESMTASTA
jgi:hypothetical protein